MKLYPYQQEMVDFIKASKDKSLHIDTRQGKLTLMAHRPLYKIAADIDRDIGLGKWSARANCYAMPYLQAMRELNAMSDRYGCDSAQSIVAYFLANAQTWKGETARQIKAELKGMI